MTDQRLGKKDSQDAGENSVSVLIEIHAQEGREGQVRDLFTKTIASSQKPGLISYEIFEDPRDAGGFYSMQVWKSADAFQAHMAQAAQGGMSDSVALLREAPRTRVLRTTAQAVWKE